ncbi:MAG: hypothetical protein CL797_08805 [Chromatiales bacterium]|nr:hypothetical protein [Chromatiales bacterium]
MACRLNQIGIGGEELTDMTTFTPTGNALMNRDEKGCRRKNTSGVVTDTAIILSRNVVHRLRSCDTRVMAGCTIVWIYPQVTEGYSCESREVSDNVTRRAIQGCRYVIGGFSETDFAVMAKRTIAGIDTHVIERRTCKVDGVMAHGAILGGRQVIEELTDADHIVVA